MIDVSGMIGKLTRTTASAMTDAAGMIDRSAMRNRHYL